jgi:hypothetical protein
MTSIYRENPGEKKLVFRISHISNKNAVLKALLSSILLTFSASGLFADPPSASITHPGAPYVAPVRVRSVPIDAPISPFVLKADTQDVLGPSGNFSYSGNATLRSADELLLSADDLKGNLKTGSFYATGNVVLKELDTTFWASNAKFAGEKSTASMEKVAIKRYPYYIAAEKLDVSDNIINIEDSTLTTEAGGEKSSYSVTSSKITYDQTKRNIIAHNVSVRYRDKVLLTVPREMIRLSKSRSGSSSNSLLQQSIGYNKYDQLFIKESFPLGIGNIPFDISATASNLGLREIDATGHYTLLEPRPAPKPANSASPIARTVQLIRNLAESGEVPVPENDPLRFHEFASSNPVGDIFENPIRGLTVSTDVAFSYDQRILGKVINNLQLSKLGEVTLNIINPVETKRKDYPIGIDPVAARNILKEPEWLFTANAQAGRYLEKPSHVEDDREMLNAQVECRPILLIPDLLFHPVLLYRTTQYSNWRQSYNYWQMSGALEMPFSKYTGVGATLSLANPTGSSPFIFDTLDANHELDLHAQYGDEKQIFGMVFKYDLENQVVYTTTFTAGPNLKSLFPRVTYDSRSRMLGLALDAEGISF